MKYYIGVDGGGTKTAFALFDENKNMLCNVEGKGSNHENYDNGFDDAVAVIWQGLNDLCNKAEINLDDVSFTLMGLAGIDHPWQHDKMCAMLSELGLKNFEVYNDGFIVIKAGSISGVAIGYNCGTGVCCNGIDSNGNAMQLMGLGDFTGDISGGTNIAVKAFEIAYNELYLHMYTSAVTKNIMKIYGFTTREEVVDLVGHLENMEGEHIRNFISAFFDAANEGDKVALDYCEAMAERGARAIHGLTQELTFNGDEVEVVLSGSINVKLPNQPYLDMLKAKAEAYTGKKLQFIKLTEMPVVGCINWIMQEYAK